MPFHAAYRTRRPDQFVKAENPTQGENDAALDEELEAQRMAALFGLPPPYMAKDPLAEMPTYRAPTRQHRAPASMSDTTISATQHLVATSIYSPRPHIRHSPAQLYPPPAELYPPALSGALKAGARGVRSTLRRVGRGTKKFAKGMKNVVEAIADISEEDKARARKKRKWRGGC